MKLDKSYSYGCTQNFRGSNGSFSAKVCNFAVISIKFYVDSEINIFHLDLCTLRRSEKTKLLNKNSKLPE